MAAVVTSTGEISRASIRGASSQMSSRRTPNSVMASTSLTVSRSAPAATAHVQDCTTDPIAPWTEQIEAGQSHRLRPSDAQGEPGSIGIPVLLAYLASGAGRAGRDRVDEDPRRLD